MPTKARVIIGESILALCAQEASTHFPNETGGAFMGTWRSDKLVEIIHMIGPGPNARHERQSFEADAEWQWREMERVYNESGSTVTYVGDWHSHPSAYSGRLSPKDKSALSEILGAPESKVRACISAIFYGSVRWKVQFWLGRERLVPWRMLHLAPMGIKVV